MSSGTPQHPLSLSMTSSSSSSNEDRIGMNEERRRSNNSNIHICANTHALPLPLHNNTNNNNKLLLNHRMLTLLFVLLSTTTCMSTCNAMVTPSSLSTTRTTATTATATTATSNSSTGTSSLKRSAAGYPRRELMHDAAEERRRAQQLREDMYASLGLTSPATAKSATSNENNGNAPVMAPSMMLPNDTRSSTTVKKRRGRPPGKKNRVVASVSNNSISSLASGVGVVKRRRGRKPGSKNKPKVLLNSNGDTKVSRRTRARAQSQNLNPNTLYSTGSTTSSTSSNSASSSKDNDVDGDVTEGNGNKNTAVDRPMSVNTKALQKFYDSDLLTIDQEKRYGYRVQYLVRCEEVHEGLELNLGREPTFLEWAVACGYRSDDMDITCDDDSNGLDMDMLEKYANMEDLRVLRPVGDRTSQADSVEFDPNVNDKRRKEMPVFVGSVTAGTGIGRGKGRAKKVPRQTLDEIIVKDKVLLRVIDELAELSGRTMDRGNPDESRGTTIDFIQDLTIARDAKKTMVKSNMRLVISIARRYQKVGVNLQDLVQEGSLGLMRATEKYDPSRGFKFSTYASWWIQQAVFRAIAYHSRTIRLPVHVHNLLNRARKVRSELQAELGRVPLDKEIAEKLNMTPEKLSKVLLMTRKSVSLEQPRFKQNPKDLGQESDMVIGESIDSNKLSGDFDESPESMVDNDLFHDDLEEMLTILGENEKRVIRLRYGMDDGLTRTVSTVSDVMNKPKSWVRSQECRALRKLRRPWYEKKLKEHQNSITS